MNINKAQGSFRLCTSQSYRWNYEVVISLRSRLGWLYEEFAFNLLCPIPLAKPFIRMARQSNALRRRWPATSYGQR